MKKIFFTPILIAIIFIGCKNNENELLLKQQKLLESQLFSKSGSIKALYFYNKKKYLKLNQISENLNKSYTIVKNDFNKNTEKINQVILYYKKQGYTNLYVDFQSNIKQALKTNDKKLETYIINNYLIIINNILDNEIKKTLNKGYHFTKIEPYIQLEKKEYSVGEKIKAKIFIKATDTTQKPLYLMQDGTIIDSFDSEYNGIYSAYADKTGYFKIKGKLLYPKSGSLTEIDSSEFEFDYTVK